MGLAMAERHFTLFDTPVGRCGMAWGNSGITLLQLPEADDGATRARVLQRQPGAVEAKPPRAVERAIGSVQKLLRGGSGDLTAIELDMGAVPPFHRRVYEFARGIPAGKTLSYGDVARELSAPRSARAVGQALGKNPFAIIVPCHRVLAAGGKLGGFTANGGLATKQRLLSLENAAVGEDPFEAYSAFSFDPAFAVQHLKQADPVLGRLIDSVGPFTLQLKETLSVYGALAEAIVYQQLSGKAAATIFGRLCALYRNTKSGPSPEQILRTPDEKLRGVGLSRSKMLSLQDLARRAKAGEIPNLEQIQKLDDEAIIERLTPVRGVGRWTVEMLLMFRLGRPDVLPVDDYGVRKGFALTFEKRVLPGPADIAKRAERWRPYRSVASWYMWRALDG